MQNLIDENEMIVRKLSNLITTIDIFKSKHSIKDFFEEIKMKLIHQNLQ
jgi:hypothetical protein